MFEEVWHVKDEWARAAADDIHRLRQKTRQWAVEHPHRCWSAPPCRFATRPTPDAASYPSILCNGL